MVFLDFLFSPQQHKANSGYYINHDTIMAGSIKRIKSTPKIAGN